MYQSPLFGLLVIKKGDKEKKFGFLISKKVSKKAVERNKIKRLLAISLRNNLNLIDEGTRGIVLAKSRMVGLKLAAVEEEVRKVINEKNNIKNTKVL